MFWKRKKKQIIDTNKILPIQSSSLKESVDFTIEATQEEIEVVSILTSAIMAANQEDSKFKIRSVRRIDEDKIAAAAIVASILAQDKSESTVRLVGVKEVIGRKQDA